MIYKATRFRQNLYAILDSIIDTGETVEIERRGQLLRIIPENRGSVWDRLEAHDVVNGDPNDLVNIDWEGSWKAEENL